jgi:hypothetical protein
MTVERSRPPKDCGIKWSGAAARVSGIVVCVCSAAIGGGEPVGAEAAAAGGLACAAPSANDVPVRLFAFWCSALVLFAAAAAADLVVMAKLTGPADPWLLDTVMPAARVVSDVTGPSRTTPRRGWKALMPVVSVLSVTVAFVTASI